MTERDTSLIYNSRNYKSHLDPTLNNYMTKVTILSEITTNYKRTDLSPLL